MTVRSLYMITNILYLMNSILFYLEEDTKKETILSKFFGKCERSFQCHHSLTVIHQVLIANTPTAAETRKMLITHSDALILKICGTALWPPCQRTSWIPDTRANLSTATVFIIQKVCTNLLFLIFQKTVRTVCFCLIAGIVTVVLGVLTCVIKDTVFGTSNSQKRTMKLFLKQFFRLLETK